MPDVTELLEHDHREVEGLFKEFERTGDRSIILRLCDELEVHTAVEEEIVYPVLFREVDRDLAEEGKQEHTEAARIIAQIRELPAGDGRLRAYVSRLRDAVAHHVKEEEGEVFPKMRDTVGPDLHVLGDRAAERKQQLTGPALVDLTRDELYEQAKQAGIEGRSKMTKDELAEALRNRR